MKSFETYNLEQYIDGWTPESLCFRYYNTLQDFKCKMDAWINLHSSLFQRKSIPNDQEMYEFEFTLGIDVKSIKWN